MKWEKPELIVLNNTDVAHGAVCSVGGNASGQGGGGCASGSLVGGWCAVGSIAQANPPGQNK